MKYNIVSFKTNRFAITDENGKIIDNANGYGYKTQNSASKAGNWKFGGLKEKIEARNKEATDWLESIGKEKKINVKKRMYKYIESDFKAYARGEITNQEIYQTIEKDLGTEIPHFVKSYLENN